MKDTPQTLAAALPAVVVEYLTVEMAGQATCGSCDDTLTSLRSAIAAVEPLAADLGLQIRVEELAVRSHAQALEHEVVASPTIRSEGVVLAPAHVTGSEARRWTWRGDLGPEPSRGQLIDLLLAALMSRSQRLERFLASGGPDAYVRSHLLATEPAAVPEPAAAAPAPAAAGGCCS